MAVFLARLFISLYLLCFAGAVFEDQVGKFDWYVYVVNTRMLLVVFIFVLCCKLFKVPVLQMLAS